MASNPRAPWADAPRVQWAQGSAAGVRSWAYHGVGKVHLRKPGEPWLTRCGVRIPMASRLFPSPDPPGENDCKRCAKTAGGHDA